MLFISLFLPGTGREASGNYLFNSGGSINGIELQQDEFDRLDQFEIIAPQLRNPTRTIQVYLPPDYYSSIKNYPVIYLQDGGLLFNPPSRDCLYDETLDRLFEEGKTEGIIAVGIFSSSNRWDEYSPWVNENMHDWIVPAKAGSFEGGEGDAYLDFMIDTLIPEINTRYRTKTGPKNTAIGGFSMGGLISLYAGLERPDVFSKVMAVSPAIWFAEAGDYWLENNQFIDYVNEINVPSNVAFYIDIGTDEWEGVPINAVDQEGNWLGYPFVWVDGADAAFNALEAAGLDEHNLILVEDPGGVHEPYAWAERFDDAIIWLFDGRETLPDQGLVTIVPPVIAEVDPTLLPKVSTPVFVPPDESEPTLITPTTQAGSAKNRMPQTTQKIILIALVVVGLLAAAWWARKVLRNK